MVGTPATNWFRPEDFAASSKGGGKYYRNISQHNRNSSIIDSAESGSNLGQRGGPSDPLNFVTVSTSHGKKASIATNQSNSYGMPANYAASSIIQQELLRPKTNASAWTNDSLGLTKRSLVSMTGGGGGNGGLVSSRKQGAVVTSG